MVNGPGEAALTEIGITGGGKDANMLYLSGIQKKKFLKTKYYFKSSRLSRKKSC